MLQFSLWYEGVHAQSAAHCLIARKIRGPSRCQTIRRHHHIIGKIRRAQCCVGGLIQREVRQPIVEEVRPGSHELDFAVVWFEGPRSRARKPGMPSSRRLGASRTHYGISNLASKLCPSDSAPVTTTFAPFANGAVSLPTSLLGSTGLRSI